METTEALLAAWRRAEAELEAAEPGTIAWGEAQRRIDRAKAAYLTRVGDIMDVEGHDGEGAPDDRTASERRG